MTVAVCPPTLEAIETEHPAGFPVFVNVNGPVEVTVFPSGSPPGGPATVTVPKQSEPGLAEKTVPDGAFACVAVTVCELPLAKLTTVQGRPST